MKQLLIITILISGLGCQNSVKNELLNQKWNKQSFNGDIEMLLRTNQIDCEEYLNYLSYPTTSNQYENKKISTVLSEISKKANEISIESKFDYKQKYVEITSISVNDETNDLEIVVKTANTNSVKENLSEIQIDIWLSKFWLIGTYTFGKLSNTIINPNSEITNTLYLPIENMKETLELIGYKDQYIPFECLQFKTKKITKSVKSSQ